MHRLLDQNHPHKYEGRMIDQAYSISSFDAQLAFMREFWELRGERTRLKDLRIRSLAEAETIKNMMNNPSNFFTSLQNIQSYHQNWQTFDFVPSNLGRGYLFYFVCDRCERRVKYLYMLSNSHVYLCRTCCKLKYRTYKRKSETFKYLSHLNP
jgi:hypothetical protein